MSKDVHRSIVVRFTSLNSTLPPPHCAATFERASCPPLLLRYVVPSPLPNGRLIVVSASPTCHVFACGAICPIHPCWTHGGTLLCLHGPTTFRSLVERDAPDLGRGKVVLARPLTAHVRLPIAVLPPFICPCKRPIVGLAGTHRPRQPMGMGQHVSLTILGHLLAQWSVSSPHCKARWEQATVEGGHKVVRAAEDAAIRQYAESLLTPLDAVELVLALKAPKSAFRALSEFFTRQRLQYSLKTGRPFPRPICTPEALDAEWRACCTPLRLAPPVTAGSPPS